MSDTQSIDQIRQVAGLTGFDLTHQIGRGLRCQTSQVGNIVDPETVKIADVTYHLILDQLVHQRPTQAFNTHCSPRREVKEPAFELRRAIRSNTSRNHLTFRSGNRSTTYRTNFRHPETLLFPGAAGS